jgi:hypothetical protein
MPKKFFISYSSKEPDAKIAMLFNKGLLQKGFQTFIAATTLNLGDDWAKVIEKEINSFDYFLVLLSENSIASDMVIEEIRRARKYYDSKPDNNKPGIFPIRINLSMSQGINYDIEGYINKFQQRVWKKDSDTELFLNEIFLKIEAKSSPVLHDTEVKNLPEQTFNTTIPSPVAPLVNPGGAVRLDSPFYVERTLEKEFIESVSAESALLRITAPRQFGKTSLLNRVIKYAKDSGHAITAVSLQLMDSDKLNSLSYVFQFICRSICDQNNMRDTETIEEVSDMYGENNSSDSEIGKFTDFLDSRVLQRITSPFFLAIDESDRLFQYPKIAKSFFGVFRALNDLSNSGVEKYEKFRRFKLGFAYAADVTFTTFEENQSPFNVGNEYILVEFSREQVRTLSIQHGLSLSGQQVEALYDLVGGHPFLVRKSLYYLSKRTYTFQDLQNTASQDGGPFDDTLRKIFWAVTRKPEYSNMLRKILHGSELEDYNLSDKLRASGIIDGNFPHMRIKNKLLTSFLSNKLRN